MKTIHTILREDFGHLDKNLIRTELLAESGIDDVTYDPTRKRLSLKYDPAILDNQRLLDIICRCGLYPEPAEQGTDEQPHGDD